MKAVKVCCARKKHPNQITLPSKYPQVLIDFIDLIYFEAVNYINLFELDFWCRTVIKSEPIEIKASEPSPVTISEENNVVGSIIKIEHTDASDNEEDDKHSDADDLDRSRLYPTLDGPSGDASLATRISLLNANAAATLTADDVNYCHGCDIKFSSQSTLIAHKRYYCKNVQNEFDGAATRSSPNQASVVTWITAFSPIEWHQKYEQFAIFFKKKSRWKIKIRGNLKWSFYYRKILELD